MKYKKASLQISMNFIVILIISLLVLGMGVWILGKIVNKGNQLSDETFETVDANLADIMCEGSDLVCLAPAKAEIGITKGKKFTLKIRNIEGDADFKFNVSFKNAYTADDTSTPITTVDSNYINSRWLLYKGLITGVKGNDDVVKGIVINVDSYSASGVSTTPGIYVFVVRVYRKPTGIPGNYEPYGRPQVLMIDVK